MSKAIPILNLFCFIRLFLLLIFKDEGDAFSPSPAKKAALSSNDSCEPSTSTATPQKTSPSPSPAKLGATPKEKCRYWDKCYRKDPGHLKQFLHPGKGTDISFNVVCYFYILFCTTENFDGSYKPSDDH